MDTTPLTSSAAQRAGRDRPRSYEIPHKVYWHNGSNTIWFALVVFIPGKNMTVAVTSNDGDIVRAESAAWAVVEASANQFNVEGDSVRRKSLHRRD